MICFAIIAREFKVISNSIPNTNLNPTLTLTLTLIPTPILFVVEYYAHPPSQRIDTLFITFFYSREKSQFP